MSKEQRIKAAQQAVEDKKAEAKRVDAELTALKLVYNNAIVSSDDEPEEEPAPNNED